MPGPAFELIEALLVTALVLLLLGLYVRRMTLVVLVVGCVLEAAHSWVDHERGVVLLVFYIPLFMLLAGAPWGDTYSLDALKRRCPGRPAISPDDHPWRYSLPARATLAMLALLFLTAAVHNVFGTWLVEHRFISNLMLETNVLVAARGLWANPIAPVVASSPILNALIQYPVILLEASFVLTLISRGLRTGIFLLALNFHAVGALLMSVTFTPILIAYLLFVDWQAVWSRLSAGRIAALDRLSTKALTAAALVTAVTVGVLWSLLGGLHRAVNFWGVLDLRTIWYPVGAVVLIVAAVQSVRVLRTALA